VVTAICALLDELVPGSPHRPHELLISFVADRPAMTALRDGGRQIQSELGWRARESFDTGLRKTVAWYLENRWCGSRSGQRNTAAPGSARPPGRGAASAGA